MSKPRLLDLFCGAGGCAVGYSRAGFEVVGVDIKPQKRYPFGFVEGDALVILRHLLNGGRIRVEPMDDAAPVYGLADFDAIHASPPCQAYTPLKALHAHKDYPDLLGPTRQLLIEVGKPWVIENVPGAPLHYGVMLCGTMFGLRVYRHRWFETPFLIFQPQHPRHRIPAGAPGTKGGRGRKAHYLAGGFVTVCGNVGSYAGEAMGIDWMTGEELSQAIPPAYTEWVGRQLIDRLGGGTP